MAYVWGYHGRESFSLLTLTRYSNDGVEQSYDDYDDRCPCESAINCKLPGFR